MLTVDTKKSSLIYNKTEDELQDENKDSLSNNNMATTLLSVARYVFDRIERLQIIQKSEVFNEVEAAIYLRLPDPETSGRQSIRYYALTAKELSFIKIGRDGLLFRKTDLDSFLENKKAFEIHRN